MISTNPLDPRADSVGPYANTARSRLLAFVVGRLSLCDSRSSILDALGLVSKETTEFEVSELLAVLRAMAHPLRAHPAWKELRENLRARLISNGGDPGREMADLEDEPGPISSSHQHPKRNVYRTPVSDHFAVIPTSLRWPHQSLIADWVQFDALNTGDYTLTIRADHRISALRLSLRNEWIPAPFENVELQLSLQSLRVCSTCWDVGYHAAFHAPPWMSHCLIHPEIALVCKGGVRNGRGAVRTKWTELKARRPIAIARRGEIPEGAVHRIERYREFVQASRQWVSVPVYSYLRDFSGLRQRLGKAKLTLEDALIDEEASLIAAVGVIANRLGYRDLLQTTMRSGIPLTETLRVPRAPAYPYASRFRGEVTPYWNAESESDETRQMLERVETAYKYAQRLDPDVDIGLEQYRRQLAQMGRVPTGRFARAEALSMRPPGGPKVPDAVLNIHRAFERTLSKVSEDDAGCRRAASFCTSKPAPSNQPLCQPATCAFCKAIQAWRFMIFDPEPITVRRAYVVKKGRIDSSRFISSMLIRSVPYLRRIDLPDSPELDLVLERFLALDTATKFFAELEAGLVLPRVARMKYRQRIRDFSVPVLKNRAWLYERYVAVRDETSADFIFWLQPDVEARLRDALQITCADKPGNLKRWAGEPGISPWLMD